jgi:hypothetical protein
MKKLIFSRKVPVCVCSCSSVLDHSSHLFSSKLRIPAELMSKTPVRILLRMVLATVIFLFFFYSGHNSHECDIRLDSALLAF